jgi:N-acyl-L-homoserine lactone synthetase
MRVISGAVAGLPEGYYGRVAHYRHRVFVEQLGWRLHAQDGAEADQFDRADTVYVMVEDEAGNIAGCARLLQTTQPYLLAELFPQLLNGLPPPRDAGRVGAYRASRRWISMPALPRRWRNSPSSPPRCSCAPRWPVPPHVEPGASSPYRRWEWSG